MMIVNTIAEQTRFNRRNHGFSLNAANAPVSPPPVAPCSTRRRRRIPEAPFLTLASSRCLGELPGRVTTVRFANIAGYFPPRQGNVAESLVGYTRTYRSSERRADTHKGS